MSKDRKKFELRIGTTVKQDGNFEILSKIAENGTEPYVIYQCFTSRFPKEKAEPKKPAPKIIEKKMTDAECYKAIEMLRRGYTKETMIKRYHVNVETFNKAIQEYKIKTLQQELKS